MIISFLNCLVTLLASPAIQLEDAEASFVNGKRYAEVGNHKDALPAFMKAKELQPGVAKYRYWLGRTLANLSQPALAELREAVKIDPKNAEYQHATGLYLAGNEQFVDAIPYFAEAAAISEKKARYQFDLGVAFFKIGHYALAAERLRAAIAEDPEEADQYYWLALAQRASNKIPESVLSFKDALRLKPESALLHYSLGAAYCDLGAWPEAALSFQKATELNAQVPQYYIALGVAYLNVAELDGAMTALWKALKLNDSAEATHMIGQVLFAKRNLPDAELYFHNAAKKDPQHVYLYWLGITQLSQNKFESAAVSLQAAVDINKTNSVYNHDLGITYEKLNRIDDAMACFKASIVDSKNGLYFAEFAAFLLRQGDKAGAMVQAKMAISLKYSNHPVFRKLGVDIN